MSTAILINPHEIQQIRQRKISPSSKFDAIARKLYGVASKVKNDWDNFSEEDQKDLIELAYALIDPPAKGVFSLKYKIWARIYLLFLSITNQTEAFLSCIEASDLLAENILDAAARQEASYQAVLSDTLEQLYSSAEHGEVLKPEETRDWLRSISDEALREI